MDYISMMLEWYIELNNLTDATGNSISIDELANNIILDFIEYQFKQDVKELWKKN